jgi:hypothetical protein
MHLHLLKKRRRNLMYTSSPMDTGKLLEAVKIEITSLQKVVDLLEGSSPRKGRGKGKRKLSPEARKAIGDAQRARWAKKRKEKA